MQFLSKNNSFPLFLLSSFSGCCLDALCSTVTELTSVVMHLFLHMGLSLVPGCAFFFHAIVHVDVFHCFLLFKLAKGKKRHHKTLLSACKELQRYEWESGKRHKAYCYRCMAGKTFHLLPSSRWRIILEQSALGICGNVASFGTN